MHTLFVNVSMILTCESTSTQNDRSAHDPVIRRAWIVDSSVSGRQSLRFLAGCWYYTRVRSSILVFAVFEHGVTVKRTDSDLGVALGYSSLQ